MPFHLLHKQPYSTTINTQQYDQRSSQSTRRAPQCTRLYRRNAQVMGNLMNAAYSVGLGSCWIHRAKEVFNSPEGKALLKKWGIEGDYEGIGHCVLGYAAAPLPAAKPRKANYVIHIK